MGCKNQRAASASLVNILTMAACLRQQALHISIWHKSRAAPLFRSLLQRWSNTCTSVPVMLLKVDYVAAYVIARQVPAHVGCGHHWAASLIRKSCSHLWMLQSPGLLTTTARLCGYLTIMKAQTGTGFPAEKPASCRVRESLTCKSLLQAGVPGCSYRRSLQMFSM